MLTVAYSLYAVLDRSLVAEADVTFCWNMVPWSGKSDERGAKEIQHDNMKRKGNKEVCK